MDPPPPPIMPQLHVLRCPLSLEAAHPLRFYSMYESYAENRACSVFNDDVDWISIVGCPLLDVKVTTQLYPATATFSARAMSMLDREASKQLQPRGIRVCARSSCELEEPAHLPLHAMLTLCLVVATLAIAVDDVITVQAWYRTKATHCPASLPLRATTG